MPYIAKSFTNIKIKRIKLNLTYDLLAADLNAYLSTLAAGVLRWASAGNTSGFPLLPGAVHLRICVQPEKGSLLPSTRSRTFHRNYLSAPKAPRVYALGLISSRTFSNQAP